LGGGSRDKCNSRNGKFEKSLWENGPFVGHSKGRHDNDMRERGEGERRWPAVRLTAITESTTETHTHTHTYLTLCILTGPFGLRLLFDLTDGSLQRDMWVCGLTDQQKHWAELVKSLNKRVCDVSPPTHVTHQ